MNRPLRILIISPWVPWPPHDGARIRIVEILRFLYRRHDVSLIAPLYAPEEQAHLQAIGDFCADLSTVLVPDGRSARLRRLISGLSAGVPPVQAYHRSVEVAECVRKITSERSFDIVQVEFSFMAHYLQARSPHCRAKTILSMHNVESARFGRELSFAPWNARRLILLADRRLFPSWEKEAVQSFDGVAAVSEPDVKWIQRHAPAAVVRLVPNGVDVDSYKPRPAHPTRPPFVVFTGSMNYPPNADAVHWFADQILPRLRKRLPELRFVIVGRRPTKHVQALAQRPAVQVTGMVEDIRPYLAAASALVVPLRSGGGTRLKILQAMAMGRPVVSTTLGAEGLEVVDGESILIADTPEQFVDRIVSLTSSAAFASSIGEAGRKLALAKYDWRQCLRGLEDLYQAVLASERR